MERDKVKPGIYLDIAIDYLKGKKYNEIQKKYNVNRWDIQNALYKAGVKTNRLKPYPPRLPGFKKKVKPNPSFKKQLFDFYEISYF